LETVSREALISAWRSWSISSSASLRRSASLTWSWTSLCSREKISFSFAQFSSDKA
jgi:hypothetical protein